MIYIDCILAQYTYNIYAIYIYIYIYTKSTGL